MILSQGRLDFGSNPDHVTLRLWLVCSYD